MPGKNNATAAKGKGMNRKSQYAKAANDKVLADMVADGIDEDSMRFGKVTKMCGNSRVEADMSDGRTTKALIRNVLRGKQATMNKVGSVLLLGLPNWEKDGEDPKPEAYVEAVLDKKTIKHFAGTKLMPASFLIEGEGGSEEEDAGFVFDSDGEEEAPKEKATNAVVTGDEEGYTVFGSAAAGSVALTSLVKQWNGKRGKEEIDVDAI